MTAPVRCGCMPSGQGCEDGHAEFYGALNRKIRERIQGMRKAYRQRNSWATGGGGRGFVSVAEVLFGTDSFIREQREKRASQPVTAQNASEPEALTDEKEPQGKGEPQ